MTSSASLASSDPDTLPWLVPSTGIHSAQPGSIAPCETGNTVPARALPWNWHTSTSDAGTVRYPGRPDEEAIPFPARLGFDLRRRKMVRGDQGSQELARQARAPQARAQDCKLHISSTLSPRVANLSSIYSTWTLFDMEALVNLSKIKGCSENLPNCG
jgi:hypothetical protein